MREKRDIKLGIHEFCKTRMMSRNPLFRQNIQYIFHLLHIINMQQLSSGIYHKLNTTTAKMTAKEYLINLQGDKLESELNTIFAKLRNSPSYWFLPRSHINTMTNEYGPATFFLTLSPGEYNWKDLEIYLREVNGEKANGKSISSLIAMDPVSTSRFVEHKFKAILEYVTSADGPLGEVIHYVWRREYQTRGMQHFHLLLWTKDAPIIGETPNEEIAQFISKYATCALPDQNNFPTLYDRVKTYQTHYCNDYCQRIKKTKKGNIRVCRFGFPRRETKELTIRSVASSIHGRRNLRSNSRLYDLPRKENENCINDYNAAILLAWEGNMDIQVICEKSAILTNYIIKYGTKPEKSYNTDVFDDMNSNKSMPERLWSIGLRSMTNRECGALEAADTILGIPLFGKDPGTVIRYVNVYMKRSRKIKPLKEVEKLDESSTDLFEWTLVDDYYPDRPAELEDICLYDFAKYYDIVKQSTTEVGIKEVIYKKRKTPCLISHRIFSAVQEPENYFYSLLLLYKPWRNIIELKGDYSSYTEAFDACKNELTAALQRHEKLEELRKAKEDVEKLVSDMNEQKTNKETLTDSLSIPNNLVEHNIVEAANAMDEFEQVQELNNENEDVQCLIEKMNEDQRRVFDYVTNTIIKGDKILRHFVSGVGGTGKSFIIKILKLWIKQNLQKEVAVTAPTGIAAFNISGLTIHRLLQLPVQHGDAPSYKPLNDTILKILRAKLKNVALIIIDEISMVSNITLLYIHLRLCEIYNTTGENDGWFGKVNVLLFGDLLQLPPVNQNPPFIQISDKERNKCFPSLYISNIWNLFTYDELTQNMRQKDDLNFINILLRIRLGIVTNDDMRILNDRKIILNTEGNLLQQLCDHISQLSENNKDTVCLLPTRAQCEHVNQKMLDQIDGEKVELIATDNFEGYRNNKQKEKAIKTLEKYEEDSSRTAGLDKKIEVKVNAKIMLRRNIDVTLGLVNGAIGTIQKFEKDAKGVVTKIEIQFKESVHNLEPVCSKFEILPKIYTYRKQFPISLAYAMTIHKSQGLSLSSCLVDIGNKTFSCGQSYVALSRVTSLEGLHIINFDPKGVKAQNEAILEYNRLREKYRPDLDTLQINKSVKKKIKDRSWYTLNIQLVELQATTAITNNIDKSIRLPPSYENSDQVSCYANTVFQCIFYFNNIITHSNSNNIVCKTLKQMMQKHNLVTNTIMSTTHIREILGNPFNSKNQMQDAEELLILLLSKCPHLGNLTRNIQLQTIKCKNKSCGYTTTRKLTNNIINVHNITPNKGEKSKTINEIIKQMSIWTEEYSICNECNSKLKKK